MGGETARAFGVYTAPATVLVDGKGEVLVRKMGMPNAAQLIDNIVQ